MLLITNYYCILAQTYHHKHSKCTPKEKPTKTAPIIRPNSKLKHECSAHNIVSNKQLPSLTRQITPDFTSKIVTNNSLKHKSSESLSDYHHRISKQF